MSEDTAEIELLKGLMTLPVEGLKTICIVNGGAVIAILTYLGNLVPHGGALGIAQGNQLADLASHIVPAIAWYSFGVFCAVVDFVIAYFVQLSFANRRQTLSTIFITVGSLLALTSAVCFGVGSLTAVTAFSAYGIQR